MAVTLKGPAIFFFSFMTEDGKSQSKVTFSHPSEAEFARILDFYQIEWQYEPRTFALRQDDKGNTIEAFSPDFYLGTKTSTLS
ncbi:MAG: hypothetical protein U0401_13170 [Anaerolineae bacterium]